MTTFPAQTLDADDHAAAADPEWSDQHPGRVARLRNAFEGEAAANCQGEVVVLKITDDMRLRTPASIRDFELGPFGVPDESELLAWALKRPV